MVLLPGPGNPPRWREVVSRSGQRWVRLELESRLLERVQQLGLEVARVGLAGRVRDAVVVRRDGGRRCRAFLEPD